jgi:hypothetical protein
MRLRSIFVLASLGVLAACGKSSENDSRSAKGEVLEGTISDAMLPVDTVRSEPPLAEPEAAVRAPAAATDAPTEGEATEAPAESEASPAAEPTAAAEPD